jgi:hypothetical protein
VVDISQVALQKLQDTSVTLQLDLKLHCGDVAEYDLRREQFDLIALFYDLDRRLFPPIIGGLKPVCTNNGDVPHIVEADVD